MEYSKAIEIIKYNYPSSGGYSALREALDLAMSTMRDRENEQQKALSSDANEQKYVIRCDCPTLGCRGELVWTGRQTLSDTPYFYHKCTICKFEKLLDQCYPQLK